MSVISVSVDTVLWVRTRSSAAMTRNGGRICRTLTAREAVRISRRLRFSVRTSLASQPSEKAASSSVVARERRTRRASPFQTRSRRSSSISMPVPLGPSVPR